MLHKPIVLALLTLLAAPALTAKPMTMTLDQLQQVLANAHTAHQSDNDSVRQLADVELTTPIRPAFLRQLLAESPGPRTTQAIRGLANLSLFLKPPPIEISPAPAPDFAAQKAIIARTIHYVARVLPTLPDFVATRSTDHFDDSPQALQPGGWPVRAGFHLDGTSESSVSFMDGTDVSAARPTSAPAPALKKTSAAKAGKAGNITTVNSGLSSWGEFRSILGTILVDASKGKVQWAQWQRIDGKTTAVFQFQIDRSVSHYDVQFNRNRPSKGGVRNASYYNFRQTVGYHGQIALDPATGAILLVLIDADLDPGSPIQRASTLVEYGPVKIGPHNFICPLRSITVSSSSEIFQPTPRSPFMDLQEIQINETTFSGYQRFTSEATIFSGTSTPSQSGAVPVASGAASSTNQSSAEPAPAATASEVASAASPAEVAEASAMPADTSLPTEAISTDEEKADEEILVRAIENMPGESGDEIADGKVTLQTTSRLVDLGLVVTDKHGKPVTDLKQEEIEVYDDGRRQQLIAFHVTTPPPAAAVAAHPAAPAPANQAQPQPPPQPADTFTNKTVIAPEAENAPDLLILLLDESHLGFQDLNRAREEVLRFLKASRTDARIALYSMSEHGFRVIQDVTQDHALVVQKLTAWMPDMQSVAEGQADDRRLRQQFDTVHNTVDLNSVNGNYIEVPDSVNSTDPELRKMGRNPLRDSLPTMVALARHFAAVPGHKCMAWISGDSALADWEDRAVGIDKSASSQGDALRHTREALNDAHIALYIVDASGVAGGGVDPSLANQFVKLDQIGQDKAALGAVGTDTPGQMQSRQDAAGRATSQMQTDLHGIQGPVRDLAEGTGGRAIRKGGDLKATLDGILNDTGSRYELGFRPDVPADGKFHTLVVKVPNRKNVTLRYRSGYLFSEQSVSTKERFQQAIWSPADASDLALTAQAMPPNKVSGENAIRLRIAFANVAFDKKDAPEPRWTDQLYIFVAVRDDAKQQAEVSGDTLRLSLKQSSYDSGMPDGIPYQRFVDVKSRLGSVRIIVVDGNSGKMGSITLPSSALHP